MATNLTFQEIFERIKSYRVIVIGDILEDITVLGKSKRPCYEGVPNIFDGVHISFSLGGAGAVAKVLSSYVRQVDLVGPYSEKRVLEIQEGGISWECMKRGIVLHPIFLENWYNQKIRFVDEEGGPLVFRCDVAGDGGPSGNLSPKDGTEREVGLDRYIETLRKLIFQEEKETVVILSDYCKGAFSEHLASLIVSYLNKLKIPVVVDTNRKNLNCFAGAMAIKINEPRLLNGIQFETVTAPIFITCGKKNTKVFNTSKGKVDTEIASIGIDWYDKKFKASFQDAIGAGDVYVSFLAVLLQILPFVEASQIASLMASLSTRHRGIYVPYGIDVLSFCPLQNFRGLT